MASVWEFMRSGNSPTQFDVGTAGTVTLTKRRQAVSLGGQGSAGGSLRVNLSWQMRTSDFDDRRGGPLLSRPLSLNLFKPQLVQAQGPAMVNVDLDLACMYELTNGTKGVVQPLGDFLGSFNEAPYIQLSGDDRFGSASGETMHINMDKKEEFRRLLLFVYIYDGTPAFDRTHAVVTLYPSSGPSIEIPLNERAPQARSCAVVLIENRKGELFVRREVRYVYGFQSELDRLYGWGLNWGRGYKPKT
ncbi:Tellurium resistance [Streptomyces sp. SL13]|uniref:Tellurium resistance n=1 Tax=Streptantibioticus silvisoli TaxID=2705255 RepID=A0AA90GZ97_9ACTN|nr:Tellurium resistance [Streptantibioticus silvisoli]MDI5961522.1 Tellurium resistance [Streptantibioticus silvisoli]MDI5968108.1 Tellurium resistance [Streptantibioticus silvisoli]